jgi:uncharacterized membrane protein
MSPTAVFLLAFLIGVVGGLRAMAAPALVAWGARLNWLAVAATPLAFMGSIVTVGLFTLLFLGELVADLLPTTPNRTETPGLIGRFVLGGLSGATVAVAGSQSLIAGAILGAIGGLAGAFGGFQARTGLVRALGVPDYVIAILEDAVAIGGGLLIVLALR